MSRFLLLLVIVLPLYRFLRKGHQARLTTHFKKTSFATVFKLFGYKGRTKRS